jgi:uncharacterized protein (TIGR02231 family)
LETDEVELVMHGFVRQRTGEDWNGVQLTLSTAKPSIAGSMPELQPWFLRPWEPVSPQRRMGLALDSAVPPSSEMAAPEEKAQLEQEAQTAYATIEASGPAVTFQLPRPESIAGDWQPRKAPIGSARLKAQFAYEATPRLLAYAFLRAKVTNATGALYLPGPVAVFLDQTFVATAQLPQVAPNETFDLYLGADERIKIERKPLKEHVELSVLPGLHGKTRSTDYEFLTLVENFTGQRVAVTVFDQIPVSQREEIIVESVRQVPGEVEKDPEKPGAFRWTLDLGPNQKQELKLSYRIRHPVSMSIQ